MSRDDIPNAPADDDSTPSSAPSAEASETAGDTGVVQRVDGADSSVDEAAPLGRRDAVREKAQQVRVQQSRRRLIRRSAITFGVVAVVAAVGTVVAWTVGGAASKPQLSPDGTDRDGFVVSSISSAAAALTSPDDATAAASPEGDQTAPAPSPTATTSTPVDIHVYVDYLSPAARQWQLANADNLSSWVADGAATLTYHPVAMLTAKSNGTKYSLRAASAAACVASYAPESFFTFNDDLLTRQPSVDSDGFSDKDLADIAQANGGDPGLLRDCIESERYASWVKAATERAVSGIEGSPGLALTSNSMVTVNGQAYMGAMDDPAEFSQFVLTTASGKSSKNATPSPTPTASPTQTPAPTTTP
ncbi:MULTISPECIES: DsbA family protein [unclassified Microbacterium]|uniref:DsbA family protein n=1 Tax=unclassified Microbacterium TaxID=2609290 RepID=UPI003017BA55